MFSVIVYEINSYQLQGTSTLSLPIQYLICTDKDPITNQPSQVSNGDVISLTSPFSLADLYQSIYNSIVNFCSSNGYETAPLKSEIIMYQLNTLDNLLT